MSILIGLGNPGSFFDKTRHNIGFMALDHFKNSFSPHTVWVKRKEYQYCYVGVYPNILCLFKPMTSINYTGDALSTFISMDLKDSILLKGDLVAEGTRTRDFLAIFDELLLPLGKFKTKKETQPSRHNGIRNLLSNIPNFNRLRIGVGEKPKHIATRDYVNVKFTNEELVVVNKTLEQIVEYLIKTYT